MLISSTANPRVRRAARLRDRRSRQQLARILIDGRREVLQAFCSGCRLEEVFLCRELLGSDAATALAEVLGGHCEIFDVTAAVFAKLQYGERADGVLAVAVPPQQTLDRLRLPPMPLVAILEGVEKPGNIGAVARSADGAGVDAMLLADPRTDPFNPNAVRASLGALFALPVVETTAAAALAWCLAQGFAVLAAQVTGAVEYTQVDYRTGVAVVLGSEAHGLTDVWQHPAVMPVRIPMSGRADSLNVSATAAVLFYEARRQRGPRGTAPPAGDTANPS